MRTRVMVCIMAIGVGVIVLWYNIFFVPVHLATPLKFEVHRNESVRLLSERLQREGVIRQAALFRMLISIRSLDTHILAGRYTVTAPLTLARVVEALAHPQSREEKSITIIPGWDLRDVGNYFAKAGIMSEADFFRIAGQPAILKTPTNTASLEGYLAPDTYRIYANATPAQIVQKLTAVRDAQLSALADSIQASGKKAHEILTLASIVEREVTSTADRAMVADIFWRRLAHGIPLQADSTVHYAVGKKGNVFTTANDRASKNPWNTYKYPGLPPGPICNPSIESIQAALAPQKNAYWFFLTTPTGAVKYARTLEEHQKNVARYLR